MVPLLRASRHRALPGYVASNHIRFDGRTSLYGDKAPVGAQSCKLDYGASWKISMKSKAGHCIVGAGTYFGTLYCPNVNDS
jgi:hypothetical protein